MSGIQTGRNDGLDHKTSFFNFHQIERAFDRFAVPVKGDGPGNAPPVLCLGKFFLEFRRFGASDSGIN